MIRTHALQVVFLALTAALLLASSQISRPEGWPLAGLYGYWIVRILIEAGLFLAFAELIGRLPVLRTRRMICFALAAVVSLFPFVLSITAMDLILGLPELDGSIGMLPVEGLASADQTGNTQIGSFFREVFFLSDNHLALCLLLTAPEIFRTSNVFRPAMPMPGTAEAFVSGDNSPPADTPTPRPGSTEPKAEHDWASGYQRHLDRPLQGDLLRIEAQEHYVRLVTRSENRMLLYRFNDIVAELAPALGMQVHRSHWVAFNAVERLAREDSRLWLLLQDGSRIPVSRKYADEAKHRFAPQSEPTKKAVS